MIESLELSGILDQMILTVEGELGEDDYTSLYKMI